MLSKNAFLETRNQQLLDVLIFVEKELGGHVQRMLKMSKVYTLAEILSKIFVKNEGKLGTLFTIMVLPVRESPKTRPIVLELKTVQFCGTVNRPF